MTPEDVALGEHQIYEGHSQLPASPGRTLRGGRTMVDVRGNVAFSVISHKKLRLRDARAAP
jgi:hypothetical protein